VSGTAGPLSSRRCLFVSGEELQKLQPHPLAAMIPPMLKADRDALASRVAQDGRVRDPAVRYQGKLLDGNNRREICAELGLPLPVVDFDPAGDGAPIDFVISRNSHRNMTDGMKAIAAAKLEAHLPRRGGKRRDRAGEMFGVCGRSVGMAKRLLRRAPALAEQVGRNEVSLKRAEQTLVTQDRLRETKAKAKAAPTSKAPDWRVVVGDNVERMRELKAGTARVVFTDPPYNNGWRYDADPTGDDVTSDDYLASCRLWMAEAVRLLADDGSIFVMIDDRYEHHFGVMLEQLGLHRRRLIVWWDHFPNHTAGNFSGAARFVLYYTKSASGFVWNGESVREPSRRNVLGDARGVPGGKVPDSVWPVTRVVGNAQARVPFDDAPPQIPDEIARRCILVASNPGDLVVDPFNGNGTTGRAAVTSGRRYVGIERSRKYARQSETWIKAALADGAGGSK
jgi:hypothetical protein